MPHRIAVVGAGIAGLSAAYDLTKAGHKVTVYEAEDFVGGRMADRIVNGICTHSGASIIFSFNREMFDLIDELGLTADLRDLGNAAAVTVDNGAQCYELRLTFNPSFLLNHPAFGLKTKVKLAALLPDMIAAGLKTDPCLMHTAAEWDDESVSDYIRRKVSEEFLENYVEPYLRAPWHWEPEDISRAYLLSLMGHVVTGTEYTFRQGIGHLTRTLAGKLDVRLSTRVEQIKADESKCTLALTSPEGAQVEHADYVVCAVQGTRVSRLVTSLSPMERDLFTSVRYNRGARVYYALKRPPETARVWYARRHPSPISLYHASGADPYVPDGFVQPPVIQAELIPALSRRIAEEHGQNRVECYIRAHIRRLHPSLDEDLTDIAEQWWDDMLPEWYPGYARKVAAFLEGRRHIRARIAYCGDYLSQSHTGGACASGRMVARLINEQARR